MPHIPQIPSRQSWSNAIGSSLRASSCWLSTSSISRNDMSGLTSVIAYRTKPPGSPDPRCRQMWSVRRSEEHTSELQSPCNLVCRLLLEKKKKKTRTPSVINRNFGKSHHMDRPNTHRCQCSSTQLRTSYLCHCDHQHKPIIL